MVICWLSECEKRKEEPLPDHYFQMAKLVPDKITSPQFYVHSTAFTSFMQDVKEPIVRLLRFTSMDEELPRRKASQEIQKIMLHAAIDPRVQEQLMEAYDALAVSEDLQGTHTVTFTVKGPFIKDQHQKSYSFYNVSKDHFLQVIRACWAGLFTPEALEQYKDSLFDLLQLQPFLHVEQYIEPEKSGVVECNQTFTIKANWQFYLKDRPADEYEIEKAKNAIIQSKVAKKIYAGFVQQNKQLSEHMNPLGLQEVKVLEPRELYHLANLARNLEEKFKTISSFKWVSSQKKVIVTDIVEGKTLHADVSPQESVVPKEPLVEETIDIPELSPEPVPRPDHVQGPEPLSHPSPEPQPSPELNSMPESDNQRKSSTHEKQTDKMSWNPDDLLLQDDAQSSEEEKEEIAPAAQQVYEEKTHNEQELVEHQSADGGVCIPDDKECKEPDSDEETKEHEEKQEKTLEETQEESNEEESEEDSDDFEEDHEEPRQTEKQESPTSNPIIVQRMHAFLDELKDEHPDYHTFLDDLKNKIRDQHNLFKQQQE